MTARQRLVFNACSVLMIPLLFQACSFSAASEISDLRLVRVDVVSQDRIPDQDKYWPTGAITEPLVRVTFSTKVDLEKIARGQHFNIDNLTSICRGSAIDKERVLRGFPSVLDAAGRIDSFRQVSLSPQRNGRGEFEYHIYFDIRQSGMHDFYSYDLARSPADVCMTVNGAQEGVFVILRRFASNTLIVSKEKVSAALESAENKSKIR